ncbi:MAG: hypothetical protein BAJALOKI3v1_50092 [Promethearchaeota archaeon]|nr:MAG: hypothetical protein BAJALOKI3v1_50092 [Candidatus Lokiarchaeota archaeon]
MKMIDVNGQSCSVSVKPSDYPIKGENSRSIFQKEIGEKLQERYPHDIILEEFNIPNSRLYIDFFLPNRKLVIEVDGSQHDKYSGYFHGNKLTSRKFARQIDNDYIKEQWTQINQFKMIRIRPDKPILDF